MQAHAEGRRVVLIVDEAQTLWPELLEQVRLLTNLETAKQKLLQIILIGQPELREMLDRPEMRQIAQRITGRYHLEPLQQGGHARVRPSPHAGRRRAERHVHELCDRRAVQALARHSAPHQRHRRPRVARRVHEGPAQSRHEARLGARRPRCSEFAAGRRGGRSRPRRPASRPSCSASRTWDEAPRAPAAAPESFLAAPASRSSRRRCRRLDRRAAAAAAPRARRRTRRRPRRRRSRRCSRDPQFALTTDTRSPSCSRSGTRPTTPRAASHALQAQEHGLRCLFQRRGTLGELRRINWPTILSLVTRGRHRASRRRRGARIRPRATRRERQDVRDAAGRAQLLLVRRSLAAVAARRCAARGSGPGIAKTACSGCARRSRKLAASRPDSRHRTSTTPRWSSVREYQRSHQLTVDGIVGARTQIAMLAEVGAPPVPRCSRRPLTCRSSSTPCENRRTSANARSRARHRAGTVRNAAARLPRGRWR